MNKKKIFAVLLSAVLLITAFSSIYMAFADDVNWNFDEATNTLTVSGRGAIDDYDGPYSTPWRNYLLKIETVIIGEGITSVGKCSFSGADNLTTVNLPNSLTSVGENAFSSCPLLKSLSLSENVLDIADISFAMNGTSEKEDFILYAPAGSYAVNYAFKNNISFVTEDIKCGKLHVSIKKCGTMAYFPYVPKISGTYRFYSVSKHDAIGYLYDSNKKQIAYNDDRATLFVQGQGSTDFGFTKALTKGETYYFGINIFNPSMKAEFDVYMIPEEYTVSGTVYAMNSPSGDASDLVLTNATMNGEATGGRFTKTISGLSESVTFECGSVTLEHTFSVDDGDEIVITMMMCDTNGDRIVNAKDYAYMLKTDSPYLDLFENFINYRY